MMYKNKEMVLIYAIFFNDILIFFFLKNDFALITLNLKFIRKNTTKQLKYIKKLN